jgi:ribosomal protein S18 acetylase RimI-like enzyme
MSYPNEAFAPDTTPDVSIAPAGPEHRTDIFDVLRSGWVNVYSGMLGRPQEAVLSTFEDEAGNPRSEHFNDLEQALTDPDPENYARVATLGGRAVGFYHYGREEADITNYQYRMLHKLYVNAELSRNRIGSKLLADFLSPRPDAGVDLAGEMVDLRVARDNHPAINLYKKFGFYPVGFRKTAYEIDGDGVPLMYMRRDPKTLPPHLLN